MNREKPAELGESLLGSLLLPSVQASWSCGHIPRVSSVAMGLETSRNGRNAEGDAGAAPGDGKPQQPPRHNSFTADPTAPGSSCGPSWLSQILPTNTLKPQNTLAKKSKLPVKSSKSSTNFHPVNALTLVTTPSHMNLW